MARVVYQEANIDILLSTHKGLVPTASQLTRAMLAYNIYDGKLYGKVSEDGAVSVKLLSSDISEHESRYDHSLLVTQETIASVLGQASEDVINNADTINFVQSGTGLLKKLRFDSLVAKIKSYFDSIYAPIAATTPFGAKRTGFDAGLLGETSIDNDYFYICVQEGNADNAIWKKTLLFQSL